MKVKELIEKLQAFDPEHSIVLNYKQDGQWWGSPVENIFKVDGDNTMVAIQPFQPKGVNDPRE